MKRILFVDDEEAILRSLKRLFFTTAYECHFLSESTAVMDFLSHTPVDLLVTDIRMPQLTGIDLLKAVKQQYPSIVRIALSGYSDSAQVMSALEMGLVKLYLYKPWDNDELIKIVESIFSLEEILADKEIIRIINSLGALPTLPDIYQKVCLKVENGDSAKSIASTIESDPAISARILRVANSAYYGSKVGSIQQAITFLGVANIKSLVLINTAFPGTHLTEDLQLLRTHSTLSNSIFTHLHQNLFKTPPSPAYASAGLLHSIGLLLLRTSFKTHFDRVKEYTTMKNVSWSEAEKTVLCMSHMQLGAYLLNWWGLPQNITETACYYQKPTKKNVSNPQIVAIAHLASHEAWRLIGNDQFTFEIDPAAFDILGLNNEILSFIMTSYNNKNDTFSS